MTQQITGGKFSATYPDLITGALKPASGYKLHTYVSGTTTNQDTWSDAGLTAPNTNPITLDTRGEASVFLGTGTYTLVLKSATGSTIWTRDGVVSPDVATAAVNAGLLAYAASLLASGGTALVGFIHSFAGSVARLAQDKMRETASYQDFGAVGDGAADDSAELIAAYASATHIVAAPGTYRILSDVTISKPTTFRAGAKIVVPTGVTLTIGADILAGKHQVIEVESGGNVVITSGALSQIIPQWFGLNVWYGGSNAVYGTRSGEGLLKSTGPTTANYMTVFGYRAAEQMTVGLEGAMFGTFAGSSLTDGTFQSAFGFGALRGKETAPGSGVFGAMAGQNNTAIGAYSIQDATTANRNTGVGVGTMRNNDTPTDNVAVGAQVFRTGTVGKENVGVGSSCGYSFGTTGVELANYRNVFVGYNAASVATEGTFNTMLGALSGFYCKDPVQNTYVGYNTGPLSAAYESVTKTICIGSLARTQVDNSITIGNGITETVAGRIRIGTSADQTSVMLGPKDLAIGDSAGGGIIVGTGSPEGAVTATVGKNFQRTNGGAVTTLYVKESGTGNTGWVAK